MVIVAVDLILLKNTCGNRRNFQTDICLFKNVGIVFPFNQQIQTYFDEYWSIKKNILFFIFLKKYSNF